MTDKLPGATRPMNKIWSLAERADWNNWPPRFFWRWLLKHYDQKNGYFLEYDK